jgi:cellulose synthase/poly-beta-1,6-N-acetylglucosamine synthase-like glycosyltransferase
MQILYTIIQVLEWIVFVYLGFAAIYIFIYAFAGIFGYSSNQKSSLNYRKFAVLIPGYKEDNVIVEVAKKATEQSYPKDLFEVIVIADSFQENTLEALRKLPIRVIEVSFEKSTKSKALNKAMEVIGDDYDLACVLDADNIMYPDFLDKINKAFDDEFLAVQGHRIAKNLNTNFAVLDAISEEVNNHIFRRGHRTLGLSSALIGSGMAFDYAFFKQIMSEVNAVGGFDKELELRLLQAKHKIEFVDDAYVMDEKVQKTEVFENQRKRWLSAQFVYFGRYFFPGLKGLFLKGNIDFADKVYQMVQPPRILLLGLLTIISLGAVGLYLIFGESTYDVMYFNYLSWLIITTITYIAFMLSIPKKFYNKQTLKAVVGLPMSFIIMLGSLFKLKGANKKFIHTTHGTDQ